MIKEAKKVIAFEDVAVKRAVHMFTRPIELFDSSGTRERSTTVVDEIDSWRNSDAAHGGGPTSQPGAFRANTLAVLVSLYLRVVSERRMSIAGALRTLVSEMSDKQRLMVGIAEIASDSRAMDLIAGQTEHASDQERRQAREACSRLYMTYHREFAAMCESFDPSPHRPGGARRTVQDLREEARTNPRIDTQTQQRNRARLDLIMNMIVAASVQGTNDYGHKGDITFDETVVRISNLKPGTGTKEQMLHVGDPDARYWNGKDKSPKEKAALAAKGRPGAFEAHSDRKGFGYGILLMQRASRPYGRRTPDPIVGIHIGPPTGGSEGSVLTALDNAQGFGLLTRSKSRYAVADDGYHRGNLATELRARGFRRIMKMPKRWLVSEQLVTQTVPHPGKEPETVGGAYLALGTILCPGAGHIGATLGTPPREELDEAGNITAKSEAEIVAHQGQVDLIEALTMSVTEQLRPVKSETGGRPGKADPKEQVFAISVRCPAADGKVNCVNAPFADGDRPWLPEVPEPPQPGNPSAQPCHCRSANSTVRLSERQSHKHFAKTIRTFEHADYYQVMRSANERTNNLFKSQESGGADDHFVTVRGVARVGLAAALAAAATNESYLSNIAIAWAGDEDAPFSPREHEYRRRHQVIRRARAAGLLAKLKE